MGAGNTPAAHNQILHILRQQTAVRDIIGRHYLCKSVSLTCTIRIVYIHREICFMYDDIIKAPSGTEIINIENIVSHYSAAFSYS